MSAAAITKGLLLKKEPPTSNRSATPGSDDELDELKTLYPGKAAHLLAKASGCAQFKFRLKMDIAPEANSELRRLMDLGGIPTVETTVTYADGGGQYKGQWDEAGSRPHGRGTLVDANGLTYEGDWVKGKCHGHGTLTNNDKTVRYTGQWSNHMKHGRGEERIDDECYVGQFELNERHGTGTVSLVDSGETVYEGSWKAGVHGCVTCTNPVPAQTNCTTCSLRCRFMFAI